MAVCTAIIWQLHQRANHNEHQRAAALADTYARAIQASLDHSLSSAYTLATLVHQARGKWSILKVLPLKFWPRRQAFGTGPGAARCRPARSAYGGNEKLIGFAPFVDARQGKDARWARDTGKLALTGPIKLDQANAEMVAQLPVYLNDTSGKPVFWGLAYAVIPVPPMLVSARLDQLTDNGLHYELWRTPTDTGERHCSLCCHTIARPHPPAPHGSECAVDAVCSPASGWNLANPLAWQAHWLYFLVHCWPTRPNS